MNRKTTSSSRFNLTLAEVGLRRPAYLQALLGIESDLEHHESYLESWLKVLEADKKAICTSASQAQKAVDYVTDAISVTEAACDLAEAA